MANLGGDPRWRDGTWTEFNDKPWEQNNVLGEVFRLATDILRMKASERHTREMAVVLTRKEALEAHRLMVALKHANTDMFHLQWIDSEGNRCEGAMAMVGPPDPEDMHWFDALGVKVLVLR